MYWMFSRKINWGHPDSRVAFRVEAYVKAPNTRTLSYYPGLSSHPQVMFSFWDFEIKHAVTLKPVFGEGGEIWFDVEAGYWLYGYRKAGWTEDPFGHLNPFGSVDRLADLRYKGNFKYRYRFAYHFVDSGDRVYDGNDLIIDLIGSQELDENGDGALAFVDFNPKFRDKTGEGPKYVRVAPSFQLLSISSTTGKSIQDATWTTPIKIPSIPIPRGPIKKTPEIDLGERQEETETTSTETQIMKPNLPKQFGGFTVAIVVPRIEVKAPPPPPSRLMSHKVYYPTGQFELLRIRDKDWDKVAGKKNQIHALQQFLNSYQATAVDRDFKYLDEIELIGHASGLGDTGPNVTLSDNRAQDVKKFIQRSYQGIIPDDKLKKIRAEGEPHNVSNKDNNPEDRRVDIHLHFKK